MKQKRTAGATLAIFWTGVVAVGGLLAVASAALSWGIWGVIGAAALLVIGAIFVPSRRTRPNKEPSRSFNATRFLLPLGVVVVGAVGCGLVAALAPEQVVGTTLVGRSVMSSYEYENTELATTGDARMYGIIVLAVSAVMATVLTKVLFLPLLRRQSAEAAAATDTTADSEPYQDR